MHIIEFSDTSVLTLTRYVNNMRITVIVINANTVLKLITLHFQYNSRACLTEIFVGSDRPQLESIIYFQYN